MQSTNAREYSLLNNSRFYILISSLLVSLFVVSWLRLQISSDQLFYIRAQQVFGLLCVLYWYLALVISPIGYVIGKNRTKKLEFARRAIGVSAFYFAFMHGVIALWGQLGGLDQIQYLPSLFVWSLVFGFTAFFILLIMALTSFDVVVKFMTFRKWKWLHRLVYAGGIMAVIHIWTIGTHLAYGKVQVAAFLALVVLAGLETFRTTKIVNTKYLHLAKTEVAMFFISIWIVVILMIGSIPVFIKNYHGRHVGHDADTSEEHELH